MTNILGLSAWAARRWQLSSILLAAGMAALFISNASQAATDCQSEKIISPSIQTAKNVRELLWQRKFAKLDRLAGQYSADLSSGEDGKSNLRAFFSGVSNSVANCGEKHSIDAQWETHRRLLEQWAKASPNSVAANLAGASFLISYGWHARGNGYASEVTDDGDRLFQQRVEQARARFEGMGQAERDNPEWYAGMLTVGLAQGWDKARFDAEFDEAIKKFPGYFPYYYTQADFYSPKWYGSNEEFQKVVEDAVRATPSLGETMYARLQAHEWNDTMFRDGRANWNRMAAGLIRINQDFPGIWNKNVYAHYACLARDVGTLRVLLREIDGKVAYSTWGSREYYDSCREFANTRLCWQWADDHTTGCEPIENVPIKKF